MAVGQAGEEEVDFKHIEDILHQWICKIRESREGKDSGITDNSGLVLLVDSGVIKWDRHTGESVGWEQRVRINLVWIN